MNGGWRGGDGVDQGPPSPSPFPASAKVSCQGANKLEQNMLLLISYDFYENLPKNLPRGLKRAQHENHTRRFPEGVKKEEIQQ